MGEKGRSLRLLALALVTLVIAGFPPAHAAATAVVQVSNFRFCPDRPFPCDPADQSYLADPTKDGAPLVAQYNPIPVTTVHRGDKIRWYYVDAICDAISGCPGHVVDFVGSKGQPPKLKARTPKQQFIFNVPKDWPLGYHPYRCTLNSHYAFGMTGVVNVVP